jgi:hypothetical protein
LVLPSIKHSYKNGCNKINGILKNYSTLYL